MDYFITGSTGLVGSHVLFELLQKIHTEKLDAKVYLLVRKREFESPKGRIRDLLHSAIAPAFVRKLPVDKLLERIECIESDLKNNQLVKILQQLELKDLTVVHIAASTNLMQGPNAEQDVFENNYFGTLNLIHSLKSVSVKRFSFISTAFSCGVQDDRDIIGNDYLKYSAYNFRNPYEGHKNKIEKILYAECAEKGIDLQILRPAVVCGRLMDTPLYYTTKFDVFYGWAKFFYMRKDKIGNSGFRIAINELGTQNIVPVDYVAKVITKAIHTDTIKQLNIVSENPPLHKDYLGKILDKIGISNYEFVDTVPEDLSIWETLYYKSVGRVFEPYLSNKNLVFDTQVLNTVFGEFQFKDVSKNFGKLIQYAISRKFEESLPAVPRSVVGKVIKLPRYLQKYKLTKQA